MNIYAKRREKLYGWMARENISLAVFEDAEGRRDVSVRWLSGHPQDAMLFLSVDQKSLWRHGTSTLPRFTPMLTASVPPPNSAGVRLRR
ncbi:MAG: hypothetical protein LBD71_06545 [Treponema sp.]|nr:hypothetical protein [Treponema sp.]